jgi:hypothetical protein
VCIRLAAHSLLTIHNPCTIPCPVTPTVYHLFAVTSVPALHMPCSSGLAAGPSLL